jgi:hypothetical protein
MMPDFQPECATMKDNLARRPVEFPPQRLHLVMVPGDIRRFQHKEPTRIIYTLRHRSIRINEVFQSFFP